MGCHAFLQGIFLTHDWTHVSCGSCIVGGFFTTEPPGKPAYAEYIMWNAGLDGAQIEIKIAGRNTNNFRYAGDTTTMAESEEELKSLLMKVKEESEKTQHSKN